LGSFLALWTGLPLAQSFYNPLVKKWGHFPFFIFPASSHHVFPFAGKEESPSKTSRLKGIQICENLVGENWAKKIGTQVI